MSKGTIIVCGIIDSSVGLIEEIYNAGYTPVLLRPYCPPIERQFHRKYYWELISTLHLDQKPQFIEVDKDYHKILEVVRNLHPICAIPGRDAGVLLANQLANDLGLPRNDPKFIINAQNKYTGQKALEKAGVRCIKSRLISTLEEAMAFFRENGEKRVVIKPAGGVSSFGVYVCANEDEIKLACKHNHKKMYAEYNDDAGRFLIQECIEGTEYAVNTVSCNGIHKCIAVYGYHKIVRPKIGKLYDTDISLRNDDPLVRKLVEYQFSVLDALGVKYGPVHSEIMVDDRGPVLIEANYRISGINPGKEGFELAFGLHDCKEALMSYISPEYFENKSSILYQNNKIFLTKSIINYQHAFVKRFCFEDCFGFLPGYYRLQMNSKKGIVFQTTNLANSPASIYFLCDNEEQLRENIAYIHDMEENHPEKMYDSIKIPFLALLFKIYCRFL